MQTITLHEKIGEDGVLRLQLPSLPRGEVEVVVVIQSQNSDGGAPSQSRDWIEATYGSLQDESFEIPEDLPWETNRLPIE